MITYVYTRNGYPYTSLLIPDCDMYDIGTLMMCLGNTTLRIG